MNKVLYLGNNDEDTDRRVSVLATTHNTINHGLISQADFVPDRDGFYHTTILDIPFGAIVKLAEYFDQIILLDQPISQWTNWKPLLSTIKIMEEIDHRGYDVVYKDNANVLAAQSIDKLTTENKSFCIYPWINFTEENGTTRLCPRARANVTTPDKIVDWKTNPDYQAIRQKMLAGERIPEHCGFCYEEYEDKGIESYRQFETRDWINKLNIQSFEDLDKITHPYLYELRLSNKCNLMCRGCRPAYSHRIEAEFKQHNITFSKWVNDTEQYQYSNIDRIDINTLSPLSRIYLTGGDPTVIPEVLTFMERCIAANKTDFELTFGTNGQKISQRFLNLCNQFSVVNFSISLDGYGRVNDYWRWGSDFDTIIKNIKLLKSHGHRISINCVPGIYNVTNLHLLYEFLDRELPDTSVYVQINYVEHQSPFIHPNVEMALDSLARCMKTNMYMSDGKSNKSAIDSMYEYYKTNPTFDVEKLRKFFEFNDKLDAARNSQLGDYIPELEAVRHLINK